MPYTLPALPYPPDALEAAIDKMTMEIHHGKHHKAYVDNLNAALAGHAALEAKPIEQLLREITQRARGHPPEGDQQRRRPRQPHDVLADHGPRRRRRADRRAGRGHQVHLHRLRQFQGQDQGGRPGPLRQRLVVAARLRRQAGRSRAPPTRTAR